MQSKSKILLIEDNAEMRENLTEILELAEYEVKSAEDGLLGIQYARQFRPDIILCDIMMPNLDGFGVLKIIQQDESLKHLPFIFLTAKSEKEDFRKGMNLGAEDYLVKPFEDSDLLQIVENKLKKYKELDASRSSKQILNTLSIKEFEKHPKIANLIQESQTKSYGKKTRLWNDGDRVNHIYYIQSGIIKEALETIGGKELVLELYQSSGFVGIHYLFQNNHNGYAEVIEPVVIKMISKKTLEDIILKDNLLMSFLQFTFMLTKEFAFRLAINSYGNVREKIAYHIVELSKQFNPPIINIGREDLASYCGVAKETLIRTLTEFKDEKLIHLDSDGIKILQLEKLRSIYH